MLLGEGDAGMAKITAIPGEIEMVGGRLFRRMVKIQPQQQASLKKSSRY